MKQCFLSIFEILLFEGRSALGPAQQISGGERVIFLTFVGIDLKVIFLQAQEVSNDF